MPCSLEAWFIWTAMPVEPVYLAGISSYPRTCSIVLGRNPYEPVTRTITGSSCIDRLSPRSAREGATSRLPLEHPVLQPSRGREDRTEGRYGSEPLLPGPAPTFGGHRPQLHRQYLSRGPCTREEAVSAGTRGNVCA